MSAKLTAKETAFMTAIAEKHFSFFDEGLVEGSGIWVNTANEEIVGSSKYAVSGTERGVASVINSIVRKGLLTSSTDEVDGAWIALSEEGQAWVEAHNAEAEEAPAAAAEEAPEAPAAAEATETPAHTAEALPAVGEALVYKDGKTYTFISLSKDRLTYRVKNEEGKASYKLITHFI